MKIEAYPFSFPEFISARNKSPALRWTKPKVSTILAHWVPFPLPGPPVSRKDGTTQQSFLQTSNRCSTCLKGQQVISNNELGKQCQMKQIQRQGPSKTGKKGNRERETERNREKEKQSNASRNFRSHCVLEGKICSQCRNPPRTNTTFKSLPVVCWVLDPFIADPFSVFATCNDIHAFHCQLPQAFRATWRPSKRKPKSIPGQNKLYFLFNSEAAYHLTMKI